MAMITRKQYQEFMEHYAWQLLKSPDYRIGQAFINYFPELDKLLNSVELYYETDNRRAMAVISNWVDQ